MKQCRWLLVVASWLVLIPVASAQGDQRCFPETGQCISGRIREFWEHNGGLPVFGYPTGPQSEIQTAPKPLPAPTFNACQEDPNPDAAPNYPVQIVAVNKASEVVTLKNVSPDPVDLTGWHMCSIKGNQNHPIGGTLPPGAQVDFAGPAANIWNNSETDNGSLYTAQGQLVSYWRDRSLP